MPTSMLAALKKRIKKVIKPIRIDVSRECKENLKNYKNRHSGESCFIIGMGPSLKVEDLDRLHGKTTFACNKIFLAYESISWRPTYYSVCDVLVAENNKQSIDGIDAIKLFPAEVAHRIPHAKNVIWIPVAHDFEYSKGAGCGFSKNLARGIQGGGCTVIYDQLQMAYHMGFSEVYLIGVDFDFSIPKPSGEICEHGEVLVNQGEVNHFHKDYRKLGETWTMPKLDRIENAFNLANKVFTAAGRKIYNASRSSRLNAFPRVDFDSLF